MDLTEFNAVQNLTRMAHLMGVETIFAGLQPGVVASLIQLEADVEHIKTALDLEDAFSHFEDLVTGASEQL